MYTEQTEIFTSLSHRRENDEFAYEYKVGQTWFDIINNKEYICTSVVDDTAIWQKIVTP